MTASSPTRPTSHPKNVFRLHGVNVLNRKNVDSIARLTAIERRRTTHILDERQRRDTMNQLLNELAGLIQESTGEAPVLDQQATSEPTQNEGNQGVVDSNSAPPPEEERKRPPVKSNSITTLRNAIAEIHRLRSQAGLVANQSPPQQPHDIHMKSLSSMDALSLSPTVQQACFGTEAPGMWSGDIDGESDDSGNGNMVDLAAPDTRSLQSSSESSPEASSGTTSPSRYLSYASDLHGIVQGQQFHQSLGLGVTLPNPDTQSQSSLQSPPHSPSNPPTLHTFALGVNLPPSLSPIQSTKNYAQTTTLPPLFSVLPPDTFSALPKTQYGPHHLPVLHSQHPPILTRTSTHTSTTSGVAPTAEPSPLACGSLTGPLGQSKV